MSTILRRKRAPRSLGPYKRHELLFGEVKPANNYTGYTDGHSTDLKKFISAEMRRDWAEHRDELLRFWASGEYTTADFFPDSLPWLFGRGRKGRLPWAETHLGPLEGRPHSDEP